MKKVIIILAMALGALSANAARTVECEVPEMKGWSANYSDENTSISFTPVKAKLTENGGGTELTVLSKENGKLSVKTPISFDTCIDLCMEGAKIARRMNVITEDQYKQAEKIYNSYQK